MIVAESPFVSLYPAPLPFEPARELLGAYARPQGFARDWELCERVQAGVTSTAYRPGPLSKGREYNLDAFILWYVRQLV